MIVLGTSSAGNAASLMTRPFRGRTEPYPSLCILHTEGRGGVIRDNQKPTKDYPRTPSPFPRALLASFTEDKGYHKGEPLLMPPQSSIPLPSIRIHAQNGEDPPWNWNFGDVGLSLNVRLFCQRSIWDG